MIVILPECPGRDVIKSNVSTLHKLIYASLPPVINILPSIEKHIALTLPLYYIDLVQKI